MTAPLEAPDPADDRRLPRLHRAKHEADAHVDEFVVAAEEQPAHDAQRRAEAVHQRNDAVHLDAHHGGGGNALGDRGNRLADPGLFQHKRDGQHQQDRDQQDIDLQRPNNRIADDKVLFLEDAQIEHKRLGAPYQLYDIAHDVGNAHGGNGWGNAVRALFTQGAVGEPLDPKVDEAACRHTQKNAEKRVDAREQTRKGDKAADCIHISVGEIQLFQDAVNQVVANGDQRVDAANA